MIDRNANCYGSLSMTQLATDSLSFFLIAAAVAAIGVILARSSDAIGTAFRIDRSITGFVMLAAATSLPELVVSCQVARTGDVDMATGSLLGSCLMNLLILAAIDLARRSRGRILTPQAAAHALASLSSILLATLVALGILVEVMPTFGRFHSASIFLLVAYVLTVRLVYLDRAVSEQTQHEIEAVKADDEASIPVSRARPIWYYVLASLGLLIVAPWLASTSISLASQLNLSGTFFGAVFLAFVTSLPEVVTTHEASRMNADDMAIGNILGSNAFNLLILVAVDACYHQPLFSSLTTVNAIAALGVIITTTIATMGLLYRVEERVWFLEPDALGVVLVAVLFFYLLYVL
jgi:cation:H+ antiporter